MIFQLRFGFAIENYYGMKRFIAIYVIAGFGGNLISAAMSAETVAIGASTSGYGMLAVLGCFYAYKWHTFGVGRNFNLAIYLGFVAFGIINTLANVGIDKYGHLGGFLFGGLIGFVLIKRDENSKIWNIVIFSSVILISILFIVFVVILATLDFNCEQDYGNSDCAICEGLNPKKYN